MNEPNYADLPAAPSQSERSIISLIDQMRQQQKMLSDDINEEAEQRRGELEKDREGLSVWKDMRQTGRQQVELLIDANRQLDVLTNTMQTNFEGLLIGVVAALDKQRELISTVAEAEAKQDKSFYQLFKEWLFTRNDRFDAAEDRMETRSIEPARVTPRQQQDGGNSFNFIPLMAGVVKAIAIGAFFTKIITLGLFALGLEFQKRFTGGNLSEALGESVTEAIVQIMKGIKAVAGIIIETFPPLFASIGAKLRERVSQWWQSGGFGDEGVLKDIDARLAEIRDAKEKAKSESARIGDQIKELQTQLDEARDNRDWAEVERIKKRIAEAKDWKTEEDNTAWQATLKEWGETFNSTLERLGLAKLGRWMDNWRKGFELSDEVVDSQTRVKEFISNLFNFDGIKEWFAGWNDTFQSSIDRIKDRAGAVWNEISGVGDVISRQMDEWGVWFKGMYESLTRIFTIDFWKEKLPSWVQPLVDKMLPGPTVRENKLPEPEAPAPKKWEHIPPPVSSVPNVPRDGSILEEDLPPEARVPRVEAVEPFWKKVGRNLNNFMAASEEKRLEVHNLSANKIKQADSVVRKHMETSQQSSKPVIVAPQSSTQTTVINKSSHSTVMPVDPYPDQFVRAAQAGHIY